MEGPLSSDLLRRMDAYWRAVNYLSVGPIYLFENSLLREPLLQRSRIILHGPCSSVVAHLPSVSSMRLTVHRQ